MRSDTFSLLNLVGSGTVAAAWEEAVTSPGFFGPFGPTGPLPRFLACPYMRIGAWVSWLRDEKPDIGSVTKLSHQDPLTNRPPSR